MSRDAQESETTDVMSLTSAQIDELLRDPQQKELLLRKLGLDGPERGESVRHDGRNPTPTSESSGEAGGGHGPPQHLTPSGMSAGSWNVPPFFGWPPTPWMAPYAGFPQAPNYPPFSPYGGQESTNDPGPSTSKRATEPEPEEVLEKGSEEDLVELLDDSEALELVEFDPSVDSKDAWTPSHAISSFLGKHFNCALTEEEREAIMKDFPKPACSVMSVPKLDEEVKEQLKLRGKDPHFGSEKSLYKLQEQVLDIAGPLTCLWADLINKEANFSPEDTLLLVQRALVLLGSASHSISLERRKIAWARINPKLKSLASEDYGKNETNLFGPGLTEGLHMN